MVRQAAESELETSDAGQRQTGTINLSVPDTYQGDAGQDPSLEATMEAESPLWQLGTGVTLAH